MPVSMRNTRVANESVVLIKETRVGDFGKFRYFFERREDLFRLCVKARA